MKNLLVSMAFLLASPSVFATPTTGVLDNLAGCFSVTYRFIEDGTHDYGPVNVTELITATEGDKGRTFTHFQVADGSSFKHFVEVWSADDNGQWQQSVQNTTGDVRYACSSKFQFNQWRCAVAKAPKPRRDEARTDYETLDRDLTIQLTPMGWVQMENNIKRTANGTAVSNESGWVEYVRLGADSCTVN